MHLRKTAGQKSEVPFDEPLSTDWDGNELLLSDILGTDTTWWCKPIETDAETASSSAAGAGHAWMTGSGRSSPSRFGLGGRQEHTQKEVADRHGHLPVLHLPAGKADHQAAEEGDLEGDGGAVVGPCTAKQKRDVR